MCCESLFQNFVLICEKRKIGLQLVQSNMESFLKIGMTCASLQVFGDGLLEMQSLIG